RLRRHSPSALRYRGFELVHLDEAGDPVHGGTGSRPIAARWGQTDRGGSTAAVRPLWFDVRAQGEDDRRCRRFRAGAHGGFRAESLGRVRGARVERDPPVLTGRISPDRRGRAWSAGLGMEAGATAGDTDL